LLFVSAVNEVFVIELIVGLVGAGGAVALSIAMVSVVGPPIPLVPVSNSLNVTVWLELTVHESRVLYDPFPV
jgi:hypothetical protein